MDRQCIYGLHRWSLCYGLDDGGLIIQDVRHDGFNLARDIRVTRIWVGTGPATNQRDFILGGADLPAKGPVELLRSADRMEVPKRFRMYRRLFGLEADFESTKAYLADKPNQTPISITERFLFGDYGKNPAHEPGGVLEATRLFPLLQFRFPRVKDPDEPYPRYFRADYRLDIDLDDIDEAALAKSQAGIVWSDNTVWNKAAIFRDIEALPSEILSALSAIAGTYTSGPGVADLFAALEKPLAYEIASWGLVEGPRPADVSKRDTWDNIHMWPAKRGGTGDAVSTPGAFHAFHCHWRWGALAGDRKARGQALPAAGKPQFRGQGWSRAAGGALVDPWSPEQNLQFAVTKNDVADWAKEENPSRDPFQSLFTNARPSPDDVSSGHDLVVWLSFEVYRQDTEPWSGTLFIPGFYFAHNNDNSPVLLAAGGVFGEASRPSPTATWRRLAR